MQNSIDYDSTDVIHGEGGITFVIPQQKDKQKVKEENTDDEKDNADLLTDSITIMKEEESLKIPENEEYHQSENEPSSWSYILNKNWPEFE